MSSELRHHLPEPRKRTRRRAVTSSWIMQLISSVIEDLWLGKERLLNCWGSGVHLDDPSQQRSAQWQPGIWKFRGRFCVSSWYPEAIMTSEFAILTRSHTPPNPPESCEELT